MEILRPQKTGTQDDGASDGESKWLMHQISAERWGNREIGSSGRCVLECLGDLEFSIAYLGLQTLCHSPLVTHVFNNYLYFHKYNG